LLEISENDRKKADEQARKAGQGRLQVILNLLMKREENLRFTTHPRLAIEATVLQLCQLRDFLSFGELLERVERLEKGTTVTAPSVPAPEAPIDPDPPADRKKKTTEPVTKEQRKSSIDDDWQAFLGFLSQKNRPMAKVLEEWQPVQLSGELLQLKRGNHPFSAVYFDDSEKLALLRNYAGEFFGRDVTVSLVGGPQPAAERKQGSPPKIRGKSTTAKKAFPPSVQDVLDVFDGEITNGESPVKPVSD
ncbi:MAG: hypothetical protein P8Y00_07285, partial [Deltaproteobacteria bacterium]